MITRLERFTQKAREEPPTRFNALRGRLFDPEGRRASFERQDGSKAPGIDGVSITSTPSLGGRLKLGAGWCHTPSPVLRGAGNELAYGCDSVAPPGNQAANREHKLQPNRWQEPGLLSDISSYVLTVAPFTGVNEVNFL